MVEITFPDGSTKEFKDGITGLEVAKSISEGLARNALAVKLNSQLVDLSAHIKKDCSIQIVTFKDKEGIEVFRHSTAHILAAAVVKLWPDALPTIGPAVDEGFYYDFDKKEPFKPEDLEKIEEVMDSLIKADFNFERIELTKAKAKLMFKDNPYKLELIEEYGKDLSAYKLGDFVDLCRGPHIPSSGKIGAFKLTKTSSCYWRGNEKNKQLQRVYGISFTDKKELKQYLTLIEEALKRDHNKLGRDLDLFITHPVVGQGLPMLTPKGHIIMQTLKRWIEDEEEKRGYVRTTTPFFAKKDLYEISGHWQHYKESMFVMNVEGGEMALRPMTCPFQFLIYKSKKRSYRELPIRYSETSPLFRNEASGEMHGLIRVRQFTLSEGHLICRPEQIEEEFKGVLELITYVLKTLGLTDYTFRFSKWDPKNKEKYIDNPTAWEESQKKMKQILDSLNLKYVEAEGEAAFYGPKLDIQMKNVFGKEDTVITVQIDFALPERYDMTYTDKDNTEKRPIVLHRSSIGCYERTMALLIEKYAGKFPLWLNPEQVRILTIADRHKDYCEKVKQKMLDSGIRVALDDSVETMNKKIREAELAHVNYILVVGDKELENNTVNVRTRDNKVVGEKKIEDFLNELKEEIKNKK